MNKVVIIAAFGLACSSAAAKEWSTENMSLPQVRDAIQKHNQEHSAP